MIERDYFSHTIPGYGKVFDKLDADRLLLQGRRREHRLEQLPRRRRHRRRSTRCSWTRPGHRANILGKAWDVIGIGAYKGPTGKKMWTVLFADKCGSTAPEADRRSRRPSRRRSRPPSRRPRPKPTPDRPPKPTARRPTPTPSPTPTPTPTRRRRRRRRSPSRRPHRAERRAQRPTDGADRPRSTPTPTPGRRRGRPARRRRGPSTDGLLETIVGGVTGFFFGAADHGHRRRAPTARCPSGPLRPGRDRALTRRRYTRRRMTGPSSRRAT